MYILVIVCLLAGCSSGGTRDTRPPPGFGYIKGGTFTMGSPADEPDRHDNETPHQVTVDSFYLGVREVTQKEYADVTGANPAKFPGPNRPVERVSWYDAVAYCNARSEKEGLPPAYTLDGQSVTRNPGATGYRLPTEAEWEYACRAGTAGPFAGGDDLSALDGAANIADLTAKEANPLWEVAPIRDGFAETAPAGSFAPNPWGLYDMYGNVWEWCWDRYGEYDTAPQTNPEGPAEGSARVIRGGSWSNFSRSLRSAARGQSAPAAKTGALGFRVARSLPRR